MGILIALCLILLLWKLGIFTLKLLGFLAVILLLAFFIRILLWPALLLVLVIAGYHLFN